MKTYKCLSFFFIEHLNFRFLAGVYSILHGGAKGQAFIWTEDICCCLFGENKLVKKLSSSSMRIDTFVASRKSHGRRLVGTQFHEFPI